MTLSTNSHARTHSHAHNSLLTANSHARTHSHAPKTHALISPTYPHPPATYIYKGLAIAIIRRSEAALQYNALIRSSSSNGGTAASQLAEFYWSPSTHKFYDNTSTEGFETVLHAAARLTRLGSKRATGHSTRQATTELFHLPIEIWYHVLSFLTRSDLDHAATARDRGLIQTAAVNDIFAYTCGNAHSASGMGVDVCPLKHAILGSFVGKTWDCYEQVVQVLVNAPSAHDESKEHKVRFLFSASDLSFAGFTYKLWLHLRSGHLLAEVIHVHMTF